MAKRGRGKDVANLIVNFLKESGGMAVICTTHNSNTANRLGCSGEGLYYSLNKLIGAGIISVSGEELVNGHKRAKEYTIAPEFMEGESWREKMSVHKPRTKKPTTATKSMEVSAKKSVGENNLGTNLLEQVVAVYGEKRKLEEVVKKLTDENQSLAREKQTLADQLAEIQKELADEKRAREEDVNSIAALELRLRGAMASPLKPLLIRFDANGVQI